VIGRLTGRVVAEEPTGQIVVDVHGVGYEVTTPVGTRGRAKTIEGALVLFTYLHVREDALELYGFASELERRVFRMLIDVPNVGPKSALGVLSALPVPELAAAVAASDVARLTKVPGIGKKTAERLALELREKLRGVVEGGAQASATTTPNNARRLLSALTNMGYRAAEAERAVTALGDRVESAPMAELLREALKQLTP
jgi:Holliday junction DNA helicase RuvA